MALSWAPFTHIQLSLAYLQQHVMKVTESEFVCGSESIAFHPYSAVLIMESIGHHWYNEVDTENTLRWDKLQGCALPPARSFTTSYFLHRSIWRNSLAFGHVGYCTESSVLPGFGYFCDNMLLVCKGKQDIGLGTVKRHQYGTKQYVLNEFGRKKQVHVLIKCLYRHSLEIWLCTGFAQINMAVVLNWCLDPKAN